MRIVICGSMTFAWLMVRCRDLLVGYGHKVDVPQGAEFRQGEVRRTKSASARDKHQRDLLRDHYQKIRNADAVLVVNFSKNDVDGYIGGSTLVEMAFAHVLRKRIFLLFAPPRDLGYTDEIEAMLHTVLYGDLRCIA